MSPEERAKVIDKIIAELKERERKEAEEARREEYLANQAASGNSLQDNNTQSFTINSDNSWYFYNTATKNAGKTDFQKRWGSRKLEDDWRRRNKANFNTDDFDASGTDDNEEGAPDDEGEGKDADDSGEEKKLPASDDPHEPEYYLAQIPQTDEEKATAHEVIQEGLYNMGVILKDKLEDFGASMSEFDRLLADYPDNVYRLDTYYNIYLMLMRQGREAEAEKWRLLILEHFPESNYGIAMADPNYLDNLRRMDAVQQELYEATYEAYLDNRNEQVHSAYARMSKDFPLSKIMPKFMFLDALAYVTERDTERFNATLRDLLERYPDTDITPIASAWLKGMAQGRELQAGTANLRGMIWELKLTNDSVAGGDKNGPAEFALNPEGRQLLVFTFATDQVPSNLLQYQIARHNFRSFVVKDFDLEQMNFGRLGMVIVRGFDNMAELNHYRSVMASSPDFKLQPGVRPIAIGEDNFRILIDEGRSFEEYFRFLDEQNYIDAQEGLLAPEDIEELPEEEPEVAESVPAEPVVDEAALEASDALVGEEPDTPAEPAPTTPTPPAAPAQAAEPTVAPAPKPAANPSKPAPAPMLPAGSEGDDDPLLMD